MALLRDPTRTLDLADVRTPAIARDLVPVADAIPNLGTGRDGRFADPAQRDRSHR